MATHKQLTDWFPAEFSPARVGVYNASVAQDQDAYRHWNGKWWSIVGRTPMQAYKARAKKSVANGMGMVQWRGLASKP